MGKAFLIFYSLLISGGLLILLIPGYRYPLIHLYLGLIMGLLIWFNTKKIKYIFIYFSILIPLIILTAIVSSYWNNINHVTILLILVTSGYWLFRLISKSIRYKCSKCGHLFSVSVFRLIASLHAFETRHLKCPSCDHIDWFEAKKNQLDE